MGVELGNSSAFFHGCWCYSCNVGRPPQLLDAVGMGSTNNGSTNNVIYVAVICAIGFLLLIQSDLSCLPSLIRILSLIAPHSPWNSPWTRITGKLSQEGLPLWFSKQWDIHYGIGWITVQIREYCCVFIYFQYNYYRSARSSGFFSSPQGTCGLKSSRKASAYSGLKILVVPRNPATGEPGKRSSPFFCLTLEIPSTLSNWQLEW